MGTIKEVAEELGAHERTLRRAIALGSVRCRRRGGQRFRIDSQERAYLRTHWALLITLREILRTQRRVRLAVLYGSAARGDDDPDSDLDLLIETVDETPETVARIRRRVERTLNRDVSLARLGHVETGGPLLLLQALDEGRVLVDRDEHWPALRARRRAIRVRARRSFDRAMREGRQAVRKLTNQA